VRTARLLVSSTESVDLRGLAVRAGRNRNKQEGRQGRKRLGSCIEQEFQVYSNIPDEGKDSETTVLPMWDSLLVLEVAEVARVLKQRGYELIWQ